MQSVLEGRTYVVVGGGRGIGALLADELASRGSSLLLAARSEGELEQLANSIVSRHGVAVAWQRVDVADHRSVLSLAERSRSFGAVDGLVNCAAILGPIGRLDEVDFGAWAATISVDLVGTASCCAAFAPVLASSGGGSVVNLSGGGVGGPGLAERLSAYTTAKAGVIALTEVLGREFAPVKVRVNAVAPGPVPTGFMRDVLDGGPDVAGLELYERTVRQHEEPESTASLIDLVTYLLSGRSAHITGRFLSAKWDSVESLAATAPAAPPGSRYTLRRIDGALYHERQREPGT